MGEVLGQLADVLAALVEGGDRRARCEPVLLPEALAVLRSHGCEISAETGHLTGSSDAFMRLIRAAKRSKPQLKVVGSN